MCTGNGNLHAGSRDVRLNYSTRIQILNSERRDVVEDFQEAAHGAEAKAKADREHVMRHVAIAPAYVQRYCPLTDKQRAYMKRFGSRPVKKRREVVL